ncbi:hypothetical protein ACQPZZ_14635 [Microbispora sp. CA-135349]|uniref:hypothetical protein n=1 Tax=Microbispora sp. CA-135349 TaxID=3239953 RepID=UPI003D8D01FE
MIWWVVAAVVAAAGAATVTVVFWDDVRTSVAAWLHRNDLNHGALMSAVILLDDTASTVRRRIRVQTRQHGVRVISDEEITYDQIDDPAVRAQLARDRHTSIDIMHHL